MEIAIVSTAMAFGPETLKHASLGGSETATLMVAKEFAAMGHMVNMFTNLPAEGRPDHIKSGEKGEDGVRYISLDAYADFIGHTYVDLLIVSRDVRYTATTNQAKKSVLWMHDIATKRGMGQALDQMSWTFDEIWTVSEWHRQQVHEVTGYPLKNIVAMRNGIVPIETNQAPFRLNKTLCYAARPERGLANLVTEGGIMERLEDYKLACSTYDNHPDDMKEFYQWVGWRVSQLPNVQAPDILTQQEMRQRLADVTAYVYPTQFEETSCILARECIEQRTPILTTREGALPETLGDCGIYLEDWFEDQHQGHPATLPEKGSREWCAFFAEFVRAVLETKWGEKQIEDAKEAMKFRNDLYWDGVAEMMIEHAEPKEVAVFSRAWSLLQDGDVVPAYRLLQAHGWDENDWASQQLFEEIEKFYPFILEKSDPRYQSLADYYKEFYDFKQPQLDITKDAIEGAKAHPRVQMMQQVLSKLDPGSTVYEYGAGEGHISVPLAVLFPQLNFVAFDQVQSNIDNHSKYGYDLPNLQSFVAKTPGEAAHIMNYQRADAVICVEVLEHCVSPAEVLNGVEDLCKKDGAVILSTPYGAWEPQTFNHIKEEYHLRNHIWHIDKPMIRKLLVNKPDIQLSAIGQGALADGHSIGNFFYTYSANHIDVEDVDPIEKALEARCRQTTAAAIIAYNNEDTILRMLNSIDKQVQVVQIALGPCTDNTDRIINEWAESHPWAYVNVIDVPKIEAPKQYGGTADGEGFGFDHARNVSVSGLDDMVDWILWIDTDEYISGNFTRYLRGNCLDGYLIPQHHFTVEPRGGQVQIDRPARLFRTQRGYSARGHIHEHFEVPDGGPGHCFMLPDIDLGHTGYVNEDKRRDRFNRNFPFLRWDHEENPDRKLHPFLWFRDIVHRMRYLQMENRQQEALALAREGEQYYAENMKEMANYGAGLPQALQYLSEIRKILGKGIPMQISVTLENQTAGFEGVFLDLDEVQSIMDQVLDPEFKHRTSRYY